ncbi:chaperonin 10-like protein [Ilyonectria robusta]|uniref:chaperonin 10-like protein n=1 Tax=Ilyonectria robusta TaxID=1079257 RepID=UPI001E8E4841|nr:chaperonin 10-like protein [Ilyonectria robusta]KAH8656289.1 chaperonin 10-like protein [Ilyonectria robusta]
MRAVVFKGPFQVDVVTKPVPQIREPTDAILKVSSTALCGSDLHYYRGHQKSTPGFVCGHETVGHIVALGASVEGFQIGDHVVVPFSTACGDCFYCNQGQSSRCSNGVLFGCVTPTLTVDGGQAEFIRVPHAASSLMRAPASIPEDMLVLMADDLPQTQEDPVAVVLGCGPVGICAIASAIYLTRGKAKIFAVDSVLERLREAEKLGAVPINLSDDPVQKVKDASSGRGADVVMEAVGHTDALELAFDLIRPFGKISSVGVHNEQISFPGFALYSKNVTMAFGRCPVRSLVEETTPVLAKLKHHLAFLCQDKITLERAPEAFELFETQKAHKFLFKI